jgi:hypothetical protein
MPQITRNSGFATNDIVTATKLHNLVDTAVISKELLTSQTLITPTTLTDEDYVLGYDVSSAVMRTFRISDILNSKLSFSVGPTFIQQEDVGEITSILGTGDAQGKMTFNNLLGPLTFELQECSDVDIGTKTFDLQAQHIVLSENLVYKFYGNNESLFPAANEIPAKKVGDVTIQFKHTSTTDPLSRTYVTTDNKTEVTFGSKVTFKGDVIFTNPVLTYMDGEDEETFDMANPPYKGLYDIEISQQENPVNFNNYTTNVPETGTLLSNQTITVPSGEVWVVRYDAVASSKGNDPFRVVWKKGDTVVYDYVSQDPSTVDNVMGFTTTASFRLTEGVYTFTARGAFTAGSGDAGIFGIGGIQRTITKIYV